MFFFLVMPPFFNTGKIFPKNYCRYMYVFLFATVMRGKVIYGIFLVGFSLAGIQIEVAGEITCSTAFVS